MEGQIVLSTILIIASILTSAYVLRKLRKSQLSIQNSIFWFIGSVVLIVISIFPHLVINLSELLGFMSPINLIFIIIIFLLLLKIFLMSLQISKIEHKLEELVQEYAIGNKK